MHFHITVFAKLLRQVWLISIGLTADIVSKHWDYPQVWHMLQSILFYYGESKTLLKNKNFTSKTSSPESKKMNDNGLEKHEPIKVKNRNGEENGQKKKMQQVSETLHTYVPGKHTEHFSCPNRW
jgi:uncharacterized membrane protein